MDSKTNTMENNLCRCCLSKGLVRNLYTSYVWLDKNEIYSDMLQQCFNIVLTKTDSSNICESCVVQLRAALQFKQQVLHAEQQLVMSLQDPGLHVRDSPDVKPETPEPSRAPPKAVPAGSTRTTKIRQLVSRLASSINSCDLPDIAKLNKKEIKHIVKSKPKKEPPEKVIVWISPTKHDKGKHKENLQTILKYSNAVPFKNKSLLGFICGYCDTPFPDPADLRLHTEKDHKKERLEFKSNFDMTEYNVKLDVSELNCTLCEQKMDNLNILKQHLVQVHNKVIYSDIKDHMLQFKLRKGDVYDCALCSSTYETFKMLKQHMNKHYNNYACNKCDTSFATKRSLNSHRTTHQKGSFKCQHCDKVFTSKAKQHYHEKTKHLGARNISNCPYCNEPFRSYYQRNQHLVKVHNSEAQYKCNVCSKSYILKSLLMYHIKKTHLMERNHQCTECGYKFFSKKALNAHMVKHTGERKYCCEVCQKSYARKYTLREHMRIHNNDRRFKCEVCAMTFVQKCSLKSHLLSNHGISMAASDIVST
ncbi:uncharacterized protein isoform X2 [Choristoneura fumiferana]|uniref:uncharacterized protein isoform X2 n=1 Tax=Choristoneura fumiferana TaxID=7141 RepID=UPI003D15E883